MQRHLGPAKGGNLPPKAAPRVLGASHLCSRMGLWGFGINKAAIPVRSLLKVIWKRLYNEKWPGLALIFQMNSGFWSKVVASCDYMSCWIHILSGTGIQQSALMLPWLLFSSCYMQEFVIMISCRGFWCLFEWIKSSINLAVSFLSDRLSAFSASDWTNTCFCKNWGSFGFLHGIKRLWGDVIRKKIVIEKRSSAMTM